MPQSVTSGDKWEYARVTRLKRSGFVFQSFILVLALCADTFGAGLAYGTNRIRVGFGKVLFLNGICSVCLGLAMTAGFFAAERLSGINLRTLCGGSRCRWLSQSGMEGNIYFKPCNVLRQSGCRSCSSPFRGKNCSYSAFVSFGGNCGHRSRAYGRPLCR